MGNLIRQAKTFSGALVGLALMLIALFWILNLLARRAPAPISTGAAFVEQHANGSAYTA